MPRPSKCAVPRTNPSRNNRPVMKCPYIGFMNYSKYRNVEGIVLLWRLFMFLGRACIGNLYFLKFAVSLLLVFQIYK